MPQDPRYIVSEKGRWVYIQTPKVACSSIKTALAPLLGIDGEAQIREDGTTAIHKAIGQAGETVAKSEFVQRDYSDYFKFAFKRSPYDRVLSCYLQKCTPGTRGKPHPARYTTPEGNEIGLYKGMSFAEFVEVISQIPDADADVHYRSQVVNLYRADGVLIPDYVGRFETLEQDFAHVMREIGREARLPHLTRSPASAKQGEYYDDRLRVLVAERFAADFKLLGYST